MAKNSLANAMKEMQRLANQTQIKIQSMVNAANSAQSQYNREEAQKSRDWQETMSRSAHQMEVEDLKKAGLNPVLSTGGSGAQSYTTSSASMTPESGASAMANIAGSQLGAMSSIESSRISAEAQKAAAASSAAAMKAAAQTSAAAQMYKADKDYAGNKLKTYGSVMSKILGNLKDIKVANINKGNTIPGIFDKWIEGTGLGKSGRSILAPVFKATFSGAQKLINNPKAYFKDSYILNHSKNKIFDFSKASYDGLNKQGKSMIDKWIKSSGLSVNNKNRNAFFNAFVLRNRSSANSVFSAAYKQQKKARTGHK